MGKETKSWIEWHKLKITEETLEQRKKIKIRKKKDKILGVEMELKNSINQRENAKRLSTATLIDWLL